MGLDVSTTSWVYPLKLPYPTKFHTTETSNYLFISAFNTGNIQQQCPAHYQKRKCVTIQINKKQASPDKYNGIEIYENVFVYGKISDFHADDQYEQQILLINRLDRENRKRLAKLKVMKKIPQFIQINDNIDYAFGVDNNSYLQGNFFNLNPGVLTNIENKTAKQINFGEKEVKNIGKLTSNNLVLLCNKFHEEVRIEDQFVDSINVFDLNVQVIPWTYFHEHEFIFDKFIPMNNHCLVAGQVNGFDDQANLLMYDTRLGHPVCLLDTDRIQFLSPIYQPDYSMLIKLSEFKVATAWRNSTGRFTNIIQLDLRFPLRRQILIPLIQYPKYFYQTLVKDKTYWMVTNRYKKYRYIQSTLERINIL